MGSFAKDVRASFDAKSERIISVPEWGRTFKVWPLTIGQLQKIQEEKDQFRMAARIIQVRAKTEDGRPALDQEDFEELVSYGMDKYGPQVVARVAAEIMADVSAVEESAKN